MVQLRGYPKRQRDVLTHKGNWGWEFDGGNGYRRTESTWKDNWLVPVKVRQ